MKNKFDLEEIVSFVYNKTKEKLIGKIYSYNCSVGSEPEYEVILVDNSKPEYKNNIFVLAESELTETPKYCIVIKDVSNKYFVVKNGVKVSKAEDSIENAVKNAYREDYKFETLYSKIANDYNNIVNSVFVYQLCDIYLIEFTKDLKYFVKKEEVLNKNDFKIKEEIKKEEKKIVRKSKSKKKK